MLSGAEAAICLPVCWGVSSAGSRFSLPPAASDCQVAMAALRPGSAKKLKAGAPPALQEVAELSIVYEELIVGICVVCLQQTKLKPCSRNREGLTHLIQPLERKGGRRAHLRYSAEVLSAAVEEFRARRNLPPCCAGARAWGA